jgi:hypothetical protein
MCGSDLPIDTLMTVLTRVVSYCSTLANTVDECFSRPFALAQDMLPERETKQIVHFDALQEYLRYTFRTEYSRLRYQF